MTRCEAPDPRTCGPRVPSGARRRIPRYVEDDATEDAFTQRLDHLTVNPARDYPLLFPQLLAFFRSAAGHNHLTPLLPELGNVQVGQIAGNFGGGTPFNGDIVFSCHCA